MRVQAFKAKPLEIQDPISAISISPLLILKTVVEGLLTNFLAETKGKTY